MKALAILNKGMNCATAAPYLTDIDTECYPINSLYYKISKEKLEVGVLSKDNLSCIEANNFKFITYWENSKPTHASILAEYCFENNLVMLNRDFTIKNQILINDKFYQNKFFRKNGIPFLSITNIYQDSKAVFKDRKGSCGKNMQLLDKGYKFFCKKNYDKTCMATHIMQDFLKYDNDYRAIVLNGKCIGIIDRIPKENEFRANISLGATAKEVNPQHAKYIEPLVEKTAKLLGSDYLGIDVLRRGEEFYILEVNFYASFSGFESIYGKNYVFNKIKNYLTLKSESK